MGPYAIPQGGAHAASASTAAHLVPRLDLAALSSSGQRVQGGSHLVPPPVALYTSAPHQFAPKQQHLPAVSAHRRHRVQVGTLRRTTSGHSGAGAGSSMAPLASAGARIATGGQQHGSMYNLSGRRRVQASGSSLAPLPNSSLASAASGGGSPRVSARQRPEHPTPRAAMGRSGGMQALGSLAQPVFQPGPVAAAGGSATARTSTGGSSGGGSVNRGAATARAASHGRTQLASLGSAGQSGAAVAHHVSYLRNSAARSRVPVPAGGQQQGYATSRSNSLSRAPPRSRHVAPVHTYTRKTRR